MIKRFCDCCMREITDDISINKIDGLTARKKGIKFQVSLDVNILNGNISNDICKYCAMDAINAFDDRRKGYSNHFISTEKALKDIAEIAHNGGFLGYHSSDDAMNEIRKLSVNYKGR